MELTDFQQLLVNHEFFEPINFEKAKLFISVLEDDEDFSSEIFELQESIMLNLDLQNVIDLTLKGRSLVGHIEREITGSVIKFISDHKETIEEVQEYIETYGSGSVSNCPDIQAKIEKQLKSEL